MALDFNSTYYSQKLNDDLAKCNSYRMTLKDLMIKTISPLVYISLFSFITIIIVSIFIGSSNVNWNNTIILYFIFLIFVISFSLCFLDFSSVSFFIYKIEIYLNKGKLIPNVKGQRYRIIETFKNLKITTNFINSNKDVLSNIHNVKKFKIELLLNNYFEKIYLDDIANVQFRKIISEIKAILLEWEERKESNELVENNNIVDNISKTIHDNIPEPLTMESEFYKDSNIYWIFDASDLFFIDKQKIKKNDGIRGDGVSSTNNRDYVKQYLSNLELGTLGELFVLHYEQNRLVSNGKELLRAKVKHVSEEFGDIYGYDILSFSDDGNEIFIEVKTTLSNFEAGFYLTKNEYQKLMNNQSYYIYRVFNFDREKMEGMIYKIDKKSFSLYFDISPKQYKVIAI